VRRCPATLHACLMQRAWCLPTTVSLSPRRPAGLPGRLARGWLHQEGRPQEVDHLPPGRRLVRLGSRLRGAGGVRLQLYI
jgi:hypothetical protein